MHGHPLRSFASIVEIVENTRQGRDADSLAAPSGDGLERIFDGCGHATVVISRRVVALANTWKLLK